jgi:VWFA-related protein
MASSISDKRRWKVRHYLLTFAVLFTPAIRAQEAASGQAVIRTETRLVLVDAVVTDKSGNYVRDLSAKDFHLWQDDKEQTIRSVSLESKSSANSTRYLVLYFDNYTLDTNTQPRVKEAALKLLSEEGAEDRLTAIAEFDSSMKIVQNFTSDTGRLKRMVEKIGPPAGRLSGGSSQSIFADIPVGGLGGSRAGRGGAARSLPAQAEQSAAAYDAEAELEALGVLARNLAAIPGRKAIILMTGGLQQVRFSKLQAAIDACNQANVAVYAVNVRGVDAGQAVGSQQVTATVAKSTGGFVAADSNDLLPGLRKIVAEEHEYYMIAYSPTEPPSGRCHKLRVKVDRDDVDVRARSNYCDSSASDTLAGTPAGKELEARLEGTQSGAAASMQAPYFYSLPNIARVNLALELPAGFLRFTKVKGKPHAALNVLAIAYQKEGEVAARFSRTVNVDLKNDQEAAAFSKMPFHYHDQFRVASGSYNLRVAFSQDGEGFGRLEAPLVIEPFDGTGFAISAVALSREVRELPQADANLDSMLLGDRAPMALNGMQFVPSAETRFTQADEANVYAEVYEPLLLGDNPPAVSARLVIVDKKTGQQRRSQLMPVTAQARPGTNVIPVAIKVPVQILPPGAYSAVVVAMRADGKSVSRAVDFEVR